MTSSLLPVSNREALKSTRSEKTEPETQSDRGAEDVKQKSTCSDEPETREVDTVL